MYRNLCKLNVVHEVFIIVLVYDNRGIFFVNTYARVLKKNRASIFRSYTTLRKWDNYQPKLLKKKIITIITRRFLTECNSIIRGAVE